MLQSSDGSSPPADTEHADASVRGEQEEAEAAMRGKRSWLGRLARIFFRRPGGRTYSSAECEDGEDSEDECESDDEDEEEEEEEGKRGGDCSGHVALPAYLQ